MQNSILTNKDGLETHFAHNNKIFAWAIDKTKTLCYYTHHQRHIRQRASPAQPGESQPRDSGAAPKREVIMRAHKNGELRLHTTKIVKMLPKKGLVTMPKDRFTVVDLFAGAGGFSCAARSIGLQVLAAVENDKHASSTYRHNFIKYKHTRNRPILFTDDINELEPSKVLQSISQTFGDTQIDIVVGGPPCQGFSKHRHKDSGVDDPRNTLLLRYFTFIHELNPKYFLMENVGGLLWPKHKKYLDRFYELAQENGYNVCEPQVLDAKNYGVPQNRKRVFILGKRSDITWSPIFQWPPKTTHASPNSPEVKQNKKRPWNTAASVFDAPFVENDPIAVHMNHSEELVAVFASTPPDGGSRFESGRCLPCHQKAEGHHDVYGRISTKRPGPTMTTGCINPSKGRFLHPFENHGITIRHAARFQTFPEDFIFLGGLMSASRQVGNAVPVQLGEVVLRVIKREMEYKNEEIRHV